MLKNLELIGFKSFADRTRFELDPGVTAIVGPNGSGKSNVVDAIRWALGEQSAKSLRGKDMADVIFNGSKTRRPLGLAEVSLDLDNHGGYLAIDADDVRVTRRIYRSGESEYLLNGQPARLRDIRDLFLGSGGGGAYNIIAQGKVEMLLQASTKDRRAIFEEASGISKFKTRKLETLRRLERIEQNLVRAQDIHEEVEKQVRGLRVQAGKAKKYKEVADRLKELRLRLGLADYQRYTQELGPLEGSLEPTQAEAAKLEPELARIDADLVATEEDLARREEQASALGERLGSVREQLSAVESDLASLAERCGDVEAEITDARTRRHQLRRRLAELDSQLADIDRQQQQDERTRNRHAAILATHEDRLQAADAALDAQEQAQREANGRRAELLARLGRLENEQTGWESQLELLGPQRDDIHAQFAACDAQLRHATRQRSQLAAQERALACQRARVQTITTDLEAEHERLHARLGELTRELNRQREERSARTSRIELLENLQQRYQGLTGGVRQAMTRVKRGDKLWSPVLGVLAECIHTPENFADLVELALGRCAQALVVASVQDLAPDLLAAARELPGRVDFVAIAGPTLLEDRLSVFAENAPWPTLAKLIECDDRFRPLVDRLLGATFVVEDFASACEIARTTPDIRLVTRAGDVLEPDGTVSVGPLRSTGGILSRAAELRKQRSEAETLDADIAERLDILRGVEAEIARVEAQLSHRELLHATLHEQSRSLELASDRLRQQRRASAQQREAAARQLARADAEYTEVAQHLRRVDVELGRCHTELSTCSERLEAAEKAIAEAEQARVQVDEEAHTARVELAVVEERLATVESRQRQLRDERAGRQRDLTEQTDLLARAEHRLADLNRRQLALHARLAELHHTKQEVVRGSGFDLTALPRLRTRRRELASAQQTKRKLLDDLRGSLHKAELRLTKLRMNLEQLLQRTREDYDIDLTAGVPDGVEPLPDDEADAARREIEDLRQKLGRIGGVNLQAVEELELLERRGTVLKSQLDDLTSARRQLDDVLKKINDESRRLFLETFETVRGHFQDLFRRLFGGGRADMILEDDTDILESGIEIIAHPPGKEPRSISLLSGGEKTMTAVALVMAIFRSKPSPFCILDEVDAALDESNIGRFLGVLREFLDRSQFLLITHSKTTMAAADVLHGVTQREAGVSIRVSVRLDHVSSDGTIGDDALIDEEPVAKTG